MKKFVIILSLCFAVVSAAMAQDFIPGTEDIPLMNGLIIDDNETVSFDTPAGQIMTIVANTSKSQNQVLSFYATTLTSMGWQKITPYFFQRGQDELSLSTTKNGGKIQVKFQLTTPNN